MNSNMCDGDDYKDDDYDDDGDDDDGDNDKDDDYDMIMIVMII